MLRPSGRQRRSCSAFPRRSRAVSCQLLRRAGGRTARRVREIDETLPTDISGDDSALSGATRGPLVVLGGTFDPPHIGHLIVADDLYAFLKPVAFLFVPACNPPHKQGQPHAVPAARFEMVRRALAGDARFTASAMEVERGGVSYTVDTVAALRSAGERDITLAVGADNLAEIPTWKDWRRLVDEVRLVVFNRAGYGPRRAKPPVVLAGKYETIEVTAVAVSSTMVRARLRAARPYRYLVPPGVYEYIEEHKLYR